MALARRSFLQSLSSAAAGWALPAGVPWQRGGADSGLSLRLIRNATCLIRYGGRTVLVDPYLSAAGAGPAINNSPNPRPNPLVSLPVPAAQVVTGIDATLVTHLHNDHWDAVARDLLPKNVTIFGQPADVARVSQAGFAAVRPVDADLSWEGTRIVRTGGQHGRGNVGRRMGAVSGYVLSRTGTPTLYLAGDTIWCPEVADAIGVHKPDVIVVNAGEAQFLEGGPITMGVDDVVRVCEAAPQATIIAVHMETVNHCVLTREALRAGLTRAGVRSRVLIPSDGEVAL